MEGDWNIGKKKGRNEGRNYFANNSYYVNVAKMG